METEADVIESLQAVGYVGEHLQNNILTDVLNIGPKSESFRELVTWIAGETHVLRGTDEKITKDTDFNEFMLELSAFLKELGCPYAEFVSGPLTGRFQTKPSRILLLDYLLTELMAAKMLVKLKPEENSYIIPMFESSTARCLQSITKVMNLGKPPGNIAPKALFQKIANRLEESIKKANPRRLQDPLFKPASPLTDAQWERLALLHTELDKEYAMRHEMLLTRLEVTIQSFQWSEKMKSREDEIVSKYQKKKIELDKLQGWTEDTNIAALLAARSDLAIMEKTSSSNVRKNTGCKIQKHVIGRVPDRGGRAYEHAPPPPEMPSWQQNRSSGPAGRGGGGRGGGGGFGGGRGGDRGGGFSGGGDRGGGFGGGNQNWQQNQQQGRMDNGGGYNQRGGGQFENRGGGQFDNRGGSFDQRPQFGQRDSHQQQSFGGQRPYDNSFSGGGGGGGNRDSWSGGGGGNRDNFRSGGGGGGGGRVQGGSGGSQHGYNDNYNRGDQTQGGFGGQQRGRSNYNRGGRR